MLKKQKGDKDESHSKVFGAYSGNDAKKKNRREGKLVFVFREVLSAGGCRGWIEEEVTDTRETSEEEG